MKKKKDKQLGYSFDVLFMYRSERILTESSRTTNCCHGYFSTLVSERSVFDRSDFNFYLFIHVFIYLWLFKRYFKTHLKRIDLHTQCVKDTLRTPQPSVLTSAEGATLNSLPQNVHRGCH